MTVFDVAVIGAGPAGTMAAIRAAQLNKKTVLLEKNAVIGKKILLTGRGRCNITNSARLDTFIEKFGHAGQFLRSAFSAFSNEDLMDFFKSGGLDLKIERQGRVFPVDDRSSSVTAILEKYVKKSGVEIKYNTRLAAVNKKDGIFTLKTNDENVIMSKKVILATGGASYRDTGSSGEGYQIARSLGHKIQTLRPGLVPLKTKENWVKDLQGLTLKNIALIFLAGKKKTFSDVGELLFTHFGVSGPLVLDLSAEIVSLLEEHKEVNLYIDLKPGIKNDEMEQKLLKDFKEQGSKEIKNLLAGMLPLRLVPAIVNLTGLDAHKKAHQIQKNERLGLAKILKSLPLTITGSLPIEEAMVTCGGVSLKEINPRTMESRIVEGLYFAGEIIEGAAASGGYNLQQAFSTGYLAGESAGSSCVN